ncbi:MAG: glycosyltransferase family 4 protein [Lentisphaerae bacterium]|nr:glycosyltransferase family 4 protein [Lentisphaerota bacterium]
MLNVVIDARWIYRRISGIGAHTRELVRRLPALDPDTSYTALFNDSRTMEETFAGLACPNLSARLVPWGPFSPAGQCGIPRLLKKLDADVFHSTNYMIPLARLSGAGGKPAACVVTIHDVIPILFKDHAPRALKSRFRPVYSALMRLVATRATRIITVSEASARDIARCLRLGGKEKISVVPNGVSDHFRADSPRTGSNLPGGSPVLLYVGRMDPYKNVPLLVQTIAELHRRSIPARLVIAGEPDPRYPEAQTLARKLGIDGSVRFSGYLSDEALRAEYASADLLVHASRYEGFGLQVLEAMASGLPVVCGNGGALPEVAGDAAVVVESATAPAFADAAAGVLSDPVLYRNLSERGIRHASTFTWDRSARMTADLYHALAGERNE